MLASTTALNGSSPRGRGTHAAQPRQHLDLRFIPARAGNARDAYRRDSSDPVHPRAGGERTVCLVALLLADGSSPRGRGTLRCGRYRLQHRRFIPARAGNAQFPLLPPPTPSVHPRAGGERQVGDDVALAGYGSSPRGRGTLDMERFDR